MQFPLTSWQGELYNNVTLKMERVHKQYGQQLHRAITQKLNPSMTNNTFKELKLSVGLIKHHVMKAHGA
jgi:hypothetical protein